MKIKLDENLPARLATALRQLGHEVDTVPSEGLAGQEDATIWKDSTGWAGWTSPWPPLLRGKGEEGTRNSELEILKGERAELAENGLRSRRIATTQDLGSRGI